MDIKPLCAGLCDDSKANPVSVLEIKPYNLLGSVIKKCQHITYFNNHNPVIRLWEQCYLHLVWRQRHQQLFLDKVLEAQWEQETIVPANLFVLAVCY